MNSQTRFLIYAVEDDPVFTKVLSYTLSLNPEHDVKMFRSGKDLLEGLAEFPLPSLITLDYRLPDTTGTELLKRIRFAYPKIPVIVISGQEDVAIAINLLKKGAYDYITKGDNLKERLFNSITNAKKNIMLEREVESLRKALSEKYDFNKTIIGASEPMYKVFDLLKRAAKTDLTLSITGETGTGKEVVAKATHFHSARKNEPFVAVNITTIPNTLLESELFGHEKGAFTGATMRRIGKFEQANKGTIFLDEIGEMDINLQVKLLRVLQEREIERIGGSRKIKLDVRVITATHRNLATQVKEGNFREDLYYRIMGIPIHLPPLRERGSDILLISKHFMKTFAKKEGKPIPKLTEDAGKKLMAHHFPGNVRELKSTLEIAMVMAKDEKKITAKDINFRSVGVKNELLAEEKTLREYTLDIVSNYMKKYNDNVMLVANKLKIGKSTIYRYLQEMEELS